MLLIEGAVDLRNVITLIRRVPQLPKHRLLTNQAVQALIDLCLHRFGEGELIFKGRFLHVIEELRRELIEHGVVNWIAPEDICATWRGRAVNRTPVSIAVSSQNDSAAKDWPSCHHMYSRN